VVHGRLGLHREGFGGGLPTADVAGPRFLPLGDGRGGEGFGGGMPAADIAGPPLLTSLNLSRSARIVGWVQGHASDSRWVLR
jgi:hypothetical protein